VSVTLRNGPKNGRRERRRFMSREKLIRYGGPAAMLGGALYLATFGMVYLIYELFAEQAKETFFGEHAFIHMFDTPMFVFLLLGAAALYLRQRSHFGVAGKAGFFLTALGFGLGAVGGAMIVVVGLTVSDEATLGVLDMIAHLLSHVFYALGSVLLGIATYRAGILPTGAALLAAVGPIWLFALFNLGFGGGQSFLIVFVPVVVTGLGWMWLGYALISERKETVAETRPAVR
jgi:hypothetical protein